MHFMPSICLCSNDAEGLGFSISVGSLAISQRSAADDGLLKAMVDGEEIEAERDIVQFVEFDQFKDNPKLLAQETLEEIPGQVRFWFFMK